MGPLLKLSHLIDNLSRFIGKSIIWLILAATVLSAGNAILRKAFNIGSNAFLEIQWYLFGAVFLLGAGVVFLHNAHVRIDVISNRLAKRTRAWIDTLGILVFLIPLCYFMIQFAWPIVSAAYISGEMSSNAGGLIRWPAYALVPAGFFLLGLQAVSELIKRIAYLRGLRPDYLPHDENSSDDHHPPAAAAVAAETTTGDSAK